MERLSGTVKKISMKSPAFSVEKVGKTVESAPLRVLMRVE